MVVLGIIVAAWFTKLPEWTTWVLLLSLAVYDLVAVLAPGGPLKLLVELASSRDEELPALVYEARPVVSRSPVSRGSNLGLLVGGVSETGSVELQAVSRDDPSLRDSEAGNLANEGGETSPLVPNLRDRRTSSSSGSGSGISDYSVVDVRLDRGAQFGNGESEIVVDEEMSPLVDMLGWGGDREQTREEAPEASMAATRGIKLGLGDFVFYSVLVGRASMYDLMTVYACYLAIISGLGCTLILLSVCHRALPALPISITLGVIFYFLTRLLMEPFVVGTSSNLMMF